MGLTIFAATGDIGRQLLKQAVAAGHDLTAVIRNADKLTRQVRTATTDLAAPDPAVPESSRGAPGPSQPRQGSRGAAHRRRQRRAGRHRGSRRAGLRRSGSDGGLARAPWRPRRLAGSRRQRANLVTHARTPGTVADGPCSRLLGVREPAQSVVAVPWRRFRLLFDGVGSGCCSMATAGVRYTTAARGTASVTRPRSSARSWRKRRPEIVSDGWISAVRRSWWGWMGRDPRCRRGRGRGTVRCGSGAASGRARRRRA